MSVNGNGGPVLLKVKTPEPLGQIEIEHEGKKGVYSIRTLTMRNFAVYQKAVKDVQAMKPEDWKNVNVEKIDVLGKAFIDIIDTAIPRLPRKIIETLAIEDMSMVATTIVSLIESRAVDRAEELSSDPISTPSSESVASGA